MNYWRLLLNYLGVKAEGIDKDKTSNFFLIEFEFPLQKADFSARS